jgi:hypothetical protein
MNFPEGTTLQPSHLNVGTILFSLEGVLLLAGLLSLQKAALNT